jgi:hypothetical protein
MRWFITAGAHVCLVFTHSLTHSPALRSLLALLSAQPSLASLRQDLLPFLTQQQLRLRPLSSASPQQEQSTQDGREPSNGASTAESQAVGEGDAEEGPATSLELPGG